MSQQNTKELLHSHCRQEILKRIETAEYAIKQVQESANNAEKSSMGDKYETDRAMGQRNRDMIAHQLLKARAELATLDKINLTQQMLKAGMGSVVETANEIYFLSVGLGVLQLPGKKSIALSPESPLAKAIQGKSKGEEFTFNGKKVRIEEVY